MSLLPAMHHLKPHQRLPFLAIQEQRARQNADLPALRALKDFRVMLETLPVKDHIPLAT